MSSKTKKKNEEEEFCMMRIEYSELWERKEISVINNKYTSITSRNYNTKHSTTQKNKNIMHAKWRIPQNQKMIRNNIIIPKDTKEDSNVSWKSSISRNIKLDTNW